MELLEEVLGEEGEDCVLGGADAVVGVGAVGVLARRHVGRHHVVGHYHTRPALLWHLLPEEDLLQECALVLSDCVDGLRAGGLPGVAFRERRGPGEGLLYLLLLFSLALPLLVTRRQDEVSL